MKGSNNTVIIRGVISFVGIFLDIHQWWGLKREKRICMGCF